MKKYGRLRSISLSKQSEPCHDTHPDQCTALTQNDDHPPLKWKDNTTSPPGSPKREHGKFDNGDVASSSSRRMLAEALKKLSSLRENSQYDDLSATPVPRRGSAAQWVSGGINGPQADGGEPLSGNWQRAGSEPKSSSSRSSASNGAGAMRAILIASELPCTHTRSTHKFNHRGSSSTHDHVNHSGRPFSVDMAPTVQRPAATSSLGLLDKEEEAASAWSPPSKNPPGNSSSLARRLCVSSTNATGLMRYNFPSPLQKSCLWEEVEENDGSHEAMPARASSRVTASRVQSMRYDCTQLEVRMAGEASIAKDQMQSQSVREGSAHGQAIAAMAKAYAEKFGLAHAVVECVSCGRALGVIVEGSSSGNYDSSFCRSCRPPGLTKSTTKAGNGMLHFCRKLLFRMGKKPPQKYTMV